MIPAGRLREKVAVERYEETVLPDGSRVMDWVTVMETLAGVKLNDADLDTIASQDNLYQVVQFTVRYRSAPKILSGDRIKWRGRDLKIHSFRADLLRTALVVTCRVKAEDGLL